MHCIAHWWVKTNEVIYWVLGLPQLWFLKFMLMDKSVLQYSCFWNCLLLYVEHLFLLHGIENMHEGCHGDRFSKVNDGLVWKDRGSLGEREICTRDWKIKEGTPLITTMMSETIKYFRPKASHDLGRGPWGTSASRSSHQANTLHYVGIIVIFYNPIDYF